MKILWVKDDVQRYIAKVYWSLHKELRSQSEFCSWGRNEDHYSRATDYSQILRSCNFDPDLIITDYQYNTGHFRYDGLQNLACEKTFIFGDYWNIPCRVALKTALNNYGIGDIIIFFKDAIDKYPELADRFVWMPPSIDPEIFKDWEQPKKYKVGFLGAGCSKRSSVYPERYRITEKLAKRYGDDFYTERHPGWGYFEESTALVGKEFSRAINTCQIFVNTAGNIGHCNPKYYEIAGSGSLLVCTEAAYMDDSGFVDGQTCVVVTEDNILDKIDYYLKHWDESEEIIQNALSLMADWHTGKTRAGELIAYFDSH